MLKYNPYLIVEKCTTMYFKWCDGKLYAVTVIHTSPFTEILFDLPGDPPYLITFEPMTASKDISVAVQDDEVGDGDEIVVLEVITDVENNVTVESEQNRTMITIMDNDSKNSHYSFLTHSKFRGYHFITA